VKGGPYRGVDTSPLWWVENGLGAHPTRELAAAAAEQLAEAAHGPFGVWAAPAESSAGVEISPRFVVLRWTHGTSIAHPPGELVSLHRRQP
jgi:hypothetical protein